MLGTGLFAAASFGCALASGLGFLIAFCILQAGGAAALGLGPRAVVTDLYDGAPAPGLMGVVMILTAAPSRRPSGRRVVATQGSFAAMTGAIALAALAAGS